MQSQRSPPLGGVDFFPDLLESVSHRSSFVMVGAGLLRLRRRVGMWLWLPGYGVRVCSRGMRWRWLLLWLLELECRLRRLCFRRCESSRERLCVLRRFFLWDGLRSLWLLWQDALSSSMSLALFCGCDSASLGKLWISSVGLPKDRCCLARSSGGSGVMLCRVVRRVGVLGSCASPGVSIAWTVWQEGDEEGCPWS